MADEAEPTPLETLHEIVNREDYQKIVDDLTPLQPLFMSDNLIFAHIAALLQVMPTLKRKVVLPVVNETTSSVPPTPAED